MFKHEGLEKQSLATWKKQTVSQKMLQSVISPFHSSLWFHETWFITFEYTEPSACFSFPLFLESLS